jgi:hypothetical protein
MEEIDWGKPNNGVKVNDCGSIKAFSAWDYGWASPNLK